MSSEHVKLNVRPDGVAIITLNRPEARNALSPEMVAQLGQAIQSCHRPDVRAALLTGAGGAFCAGGDVKDFVEQLEQGGADGLSQGLRDLADALHRDVILGIRRLPKPVVAGVNGVAAGAGFSLTLACDLRVASRSAQFLMAYAGIGSSADGGSTFMLPRIVGMGKAMEMYLASQPMSAEYALAAGLVNQIFPAEEFERHALETTLRLAQGPTLAYGQVKALFDSAWNTDLEAHLNSETEAISSIGRTQDFQTGIKAFTEKHLPWFQGR